MFVTRNNEPQRRKCFLTAAHDEREFTDKEMETLSALFFEGLDNIRTDSGLTRSEIEVLQLLANGLTQDEIAVKLEISRLSVKKRTERARRAIDARNTIHAVTKAIAVGVVTVWEV